MSVNFTWLILSALALCASCSSIEARAPGPVLAAEAPSARAGSELVFRRVPERAAGGGIQVLHGVVTKSVDWPALLVADIGQVQPDGTQSAWVCSAALIGPQVVLTAAHCVDAGNSSEPKSASLQLSEGILIAMTCTMSPTYLATSFSEGLARNSADYALCRLSVNVSSIPAYKTLEYENIDTTGVLEVGSRVLITGYGCTSFAIANGKIKFGPAAEVMSVGDATVSATTGAIALSERNYVQTRSLNAAQAALCPGDSGGPLVTGASQSNQTSSRRITGVNSSIEVTSSEDLTSRFAELSTSDFITFLTSWLAAEAKTNGGFSPGVCGYNWSAGKFPCRA
jgi:hypothetical protein